MNRMIVTFCAKMLHSPKDFLMLFGSGRQTDKQSHKQMTFNRGSESSLSFRIPPEELAESLSSYDVVSFALTGTLVLYPFSEMTDLFLLMQEMLHYPDFARIRQEMEQKLGEGQSDRCMMEHQEGSKSKCCEYEHHAGIGLSELYGLLERETGLEKEPAMALELYLLRELAFVNPYIRQVVKELRRMGKRIVVIADTYLGAGQVRSVLQNVGYGEFDAYYLSGEQGCFARDGGLYDQARCLEQAFYHTTHPADHFCAAHVGDHSRTDVECAKQHGFTPFYYKNVNAAGDAYRAHDMSALTGSLYRGMVNAHIHNGLSVYSEAYEYGYIYGGLFVTGYCRFIHEYVHRHRTDKILFLARDGDVLSKAYHLLYPGEDASQSYVCWSRLAAAKLSAGKYRYDFFRRFLYQKVNQGYTLEQVFASMELEDMLDMVCPKCGFSAHTRLTDSNTDRLKDCLIDSWDQVLSYYKEQVAAGKIYYERILAGCKSAVAVDIGWSGSGMMALDYMVNEVWNLDCEMTGLIAGTDTCHCDQSDAAEPMLKNGKLTAYLYAPYMNRDLWKNHDPGLGHNLYWELLLASPTGSFVGFYPDGAGGCECRFRSPDLEEKTALEIQRGILDFVRGWDWLSDRLQKSGRQHGACGISGRDAYAPMLQVLSGKNRPSGKKDTVFEMGMRL